MKKCKSCGQNIIADKRTIKQNASLHLLLSQVSKEMIEKGIDLREVVKEEVPIPCTPENLKWMWKLLQKAMYGTKSTTELKKSGEIDLIYDTFNKILIERTQGQVSLPPFPCIELLMEEDK